MFASFVVWQEAIEYIYIYVITLELCSEMEKERIIHIPEYNWRREKGGWFFGCEEIVPSRHNHKSFYSNSRDFECGSVEFFASICSNSSDATNRTYTLIGNNSGRCCLESRKVKLLFLPFRIRSFVRSIVQRFLSSFTLRAHKIEWIQKLEHAFGQEAQHGITHRNESKLIWAEYKKKKKL